MPTLEKQREKDAIHLAAPYLRGLAANSALTSSTPDGTYECRRRELRQSLSSNVNASVETHLAIGMQEFGDSAVSAEVSPRKLYFDGVLKGYETPGTGVVAVGRKPQDSAIQLFAIALPDLYTIAIPDRTSTHKELVLINGRDASLQFYANCVLQLASASFENEGAKTWVSTTPLSEPLEDPFESILAQRIFMARFAVQAWQKKGASQKLVGRVLELIDDARSEYPDTEIPNFQAIQSYFSFFNEVRGATRPVTGVAGAGGLIAQWRQSSGYALALQFLRNGRVNVAAFFRDPDEPLTPGSFTANYTWRAAAKELQRNEALKWVFS